MQKNIVTSATVLYIKPLGENNSSVCFLTQTEGILYATMYGGPKSRLKGLVSTWNTGTAYFSRNNKTNNYKVSDFDVKNYHLTFRENLLKSCFASVAAELALKTKCAGNNLSCWALINGFINGLDKCTSEEQCKDGLIRFLWRYLELLGLQPNAYYCQHCDEPIKGDALFNPVENGFICSNCRYFGKEEKSGFIVSEEGTKYLSLITMNQIASLGYYTLSDRTENELRSLLLYLTENACGSSLSSLKMLNLL